MSEKQPISIRHTPEVVTGEKASLSAWIERCDEVTDEEAEDGNGEARDAAQDELDRLRRKLDLPERRDSYQALVEQEHLTETEADELAQLTLHLGWA